MSSGHLVNHGNLADAFADASANALADALADVC